MNDGSKSIRFVIINVIQFNRVTLSSRQRKTEGNN